MFNILKGTRGLHPTHFLYKTLLINKNNIHSFLIKENKESPMTNQILEIRQETNQKKKKQS